MQPVPRRVVQSYHVRYQLGSIFNDRQDSNVADAIDLHVHAQTGTEDPFEIAKGATRAQMGTVVFKNLSGYGARWNTLQQVVEETQRWAEAQDLRPVQCFFGAQTDPAYGGLSFDQVKES